MFPWTELPAVESGIQEGIDRQLHISLQIYVSLNGVVVLDLLTHQSGFPQSETGD